MQRVNQKLLGLIILGSAVFVAGVLLTYGREAGPGAIEPRQTFVNVQRAKPETKMAVVTAYGVIQGDRILQVNPQVTGRIIELSPNLVDGGLVKSGEVLLRVDPRDFEAQVQQEKAAVKKAESELKLETGKSVVAQREWELLSESIPRSELGEELALRLPQLREKEAALEAAKSKLTKARLDLERTVITAPFDAIVLEEFVEFDQLVTPSTKIATLVAVGDFRVQVSIPYDRLQWIRYETDETPSIARVILESGREDLVTREGTVMRLLPGLDPDGRMARILLRIRNPLGLDDDAIDPLLIGSYVRVEIDGPQLEAVYELPARALRDGNSVYLVKEGRLHIQEVDVVMRKGDQVVIDKGLNEGDLVIISPITLPVEGMSVEIANVVDKD